MKNNFWHLLMLAVLSLTATCLVACSSSSDDEPTPTPQPQPQPVKGTFTLNVNASLSGAATRGTLTYVDNVYNLAWTAADRVDVKKKDGTSVGTLSALTTGDASSDLAGTVSGTFAVNDELTLTYPKAPVSYADQKGTLADLGANYAFATATVTVATVSESVITTGDAAFAAQHAIVKFTLKDEKGVAINATSLTIEGCDQTVSVTPESAASELYVSVPAIANKNLTLKATAGSATYQYNRTNVTFEAGKHYTQNVTMGQSGSYDANTQPLTFQAIKEGTITYTAANAGYTVEYKKNNGGWTTYSYSSAISVAVGDVVSFRGTNATYYVSIGEGTGDLSTFVCSSACYIYGNVMSLISKESFSTITKFTAAKAFLRMFKNQANLRSHPYKDLVLPATILAEQCYREMVSGCTGLTRSAILDKAVGAENAYQWMYKGCSNLSEVTCYAEYNSTYFENWLTGVASSGTFYTTTEHKTYWESFLSANISGWTVVGK